ncbi:CheR family methyltransferase [Acidisoma sp. C75]
MARPEGGQALPATESEREAFAALKQAIIARTGHDYYRDKDPLLCERLHRRRIATEMADLAGYQELLASPRIGDAEWRELEAEITIGETFFFRHQEQVSALRDVILPRLIEQGADRRRLRIWSAGCSVGAEAYSLAILLERVLGQAAQNWTIDIIGTDISSRALAQARAGTYGEWALRGVPAEERARDFVRAGARGWEIAPRHRQRVRFERHNLLDLPKVGAPGLWREFDLILCRNVLIYFGTERIVGTLMALSRCLAPQGWLMVGHSDAIATLPPDLTVVELPGTLAFRPGAGKPGADKPGADKPEASPFGASAFANSPAAGVGIGGAACPETRAGRPPPPQPVGPSAAHNPLAPRPSDEPPAAKPPAAMAARGTGLALPAPSAAALIPTVKALADAGRLAEAAAAVAEALRQDPLDARLHFYDGVIAQAAGRAGAAETALRRAIYLSGEMVMAHYHLGLLLSAAGRSGEAARVLGQLQRLCAALPEDRRLPDGDGLTARGLMERLGSMAGRRRALRNGPGGAAADAR